MSFPDGAGKSTDGSHQDQRNFGPNSRRRCSPNWIWDFAADFRGLFREKERLDVGTPGVDEKEEIHTKRVRSVAGGSDNGVELEDE